MIRAMTRIAVVACALVAACAGTQDDTAATLPTATTPPAVSAPSVETTSSIEASADAVPGPVVLRPGRAVILEPGIYTSDHFVVPFQLMVTEDGWRLLAIHDRFVEFGYRETGESALGVLVGMIGSSASKTPEEAIESLLGMDRVEALGTSVPSTVGGLPAIAIDVSVGPNRSGECVFGVPLVSFPGVEWGIDDCTDARVWAVATMGRAVLIVANVDDDAEWDAMMAPVERLITELDFG